MHFLDYGAGPVVLLLHGAPSTPAHLEPLGQSLAARRRVLVPDLPGYGASPALAGDYDLDRVQQLLEDELLARGVRELAIVGHSLGGWRALELALSSRVRVTHVISLAGFAHPDEALRAVLAKNAELLRSGFDFRPHLVAAMTGPGFAEQHPREAAEIVTWIDAAPREVIAAELDAIATAKDRRAKLRELQAPILARVGALDGAVPPRLSEDIARWAPRTTVQIVPGSGHALLHEDRDATIAATMGFLGG